MNTIPRLAQRLVLILAGLVLASSAHAGLSVSGTQLKESNGNTLILRGINLPHAWFADRTDAALAQIAATGANSVRVVPVPATAGTARPRPRWRASSRAAKPWG